jgi:hypothetical protein
MVETTKAPQIGLEPTTVLTENLDTDRVAIGESKTELERLLLAKIS